MAKLGIPKYQMTTDVAAFLLVALTFPSSTRPILFVLGLFILMAATGGFYRSRLNLSLFDDGPALLGRLLAASAVVAATSTVIGVQLPSSWWWAVTVAATLMLLGRAVVHGGARALRRRRWVSHSAIIVGSGVVGRELADNLRAHPRYGLDPVCFYDPHPDGSTLPLPVLGAENSGRPGMSLEAVSSALHANVVIVAFTQTAEADLVDVVRTCSKLDAEMFAVPRLFELHSADGREVEDVWGTPLVRLRRASYRSRAWTGKRAMDLIFSSVALLLLSPLLATISLAVLISMGRPIFFRQERVGVDGHPFSIIKFRSLPNASDARTDTEWTSSARPPNALGGFLRSTSLDELPQLWNIVRGDMSLVGPRPERPQFVETFSAIYDRYGHRHRVPSGLTGLAQVNGLRGDTPIGDRTRFDNAYVERWSLRSDIKILLQTIGAVLRRTGQ